MEETEMMMQVETIINDATPIVDVARGISDYGALAVMGAAFILISIVTQWSIFKWFKTIIDNLLKNTSCTMDELLAETKTQNEQLADIADGLRSKTLLEIKDITKTCFDLSAERVCRIIKQVKQENNISDQEGTKKKIRTLLTNLHEDRNSRFDNHRYHGKQLTYYTTRKWIDWVQDVVEKEVYNSIENETRTRTNVTTVYDRIKLDLYHKLTDQ
jgi:hypothetical protein